MRILHYFETMPSRSIATGRSSPDFVERTCPTLEEVRHVLGVQSPSPLRTKKREKLKNLEKLKREEAEGSEVSVLREEVDRLRKLNAVLWNDNWRMHQIIMTNLAQASALTPDPHRVEPKPKKKM